MVFQQREQCTVIGSQYDQLHLLERSVLCGGELV